MTPGTSKKRGLCVPVLVCIWAETQTCRGGGSYLSRTLLSMILQQQETAGLEGGPPGDGMLQTDIERPQREAVPLLSFACGWPRCFHRKVSLLGISSAT